MSSSFIYTPVGSCSQLAESEFRMLVIHSLLGFIRRYRNGKRIGLLCYLSVSPSVRHLRPYFSLTDRGRCQEEIIITNIFKSFRSFLLLFLLKKRYFSFKYLLFHNCAKSKTSRAICPVVYTLKNFYLPILR